ncbi:MAG: DUF4340 domain-containing protein [Dehalococcoidales bacterium]
MRLRSILILLAAMLALGGYFYFTNRPEPPVKEEPRKFAWLIEMDDIQRIEVSLPREGKSQAFIKIPREDQFPWFFDDEAKTDIDVQRWGGGIPLLLSGPGVERIISENTSDEKLAEFGISDPQMTVNLTMLDGYQMLIRVGDITPDGRSFYVQAPNTRDVALVDISWYEVIARLINEPPYVPVEED